MSNRMLPLVLLATSLALTGCNDDSNGNNGPSPDQSFNQVQRLGNPLVSEVLLSKRSHPVHANIAPVDDPAFVGAEIKAFITTVAGRAPAYADALGGVLLPDVLVVQTDKEPAGAGWLTWLPLAPFANGWGGRTLENDVTDLALLAVFGDPLGLDPAGAVGKEGLTTDNVGNDSQPLATFPYMAAPN